MKMTVEVEIPDDVAKNIGYRLGIENHVLFTARQAVADYVDNEVNPGGCWCTGVGHLITCRHHVIPY